MILNKIEFTEDTYKNVNIGDTLVTIDNVTVTVDDEVLASLEEAYAVYLIQQDINNKALEKVSLQLKLDKAVDKKLTTIKNKFIEASIKPRVSVQLISVDKIIYVDGGRTNKDDFKETWENMADDETTIVKDADNNFQNDLTKDDLYVIYKSILANGKALYTRKWELETIVNSAETTEDVDAMQVSF